MTLFSESPLFWLLALIGASVAAFLLARPLLRARSGYTAAERRQANIAIYRDQLKELEADRDNGLLDPAQFEAARQEIEARLAEDALAPGVEATPTAMAGGRGLAYTLAAVLPIAAFGLYFLFGSPAALQVTGRPDQVAAQNAEQIETMIRAVEERVRKDPKDARSWLMLARTYFALERWPEAVQAYAKASQLLPEEAMVWSGYAEALALRNGRKLDGEPLDLLEKALKLDPNDPKALELMGIHAFGEEDYARAVTFWNRLLKVMPQAEFAQEIRGAIQEARRLAAEAGKPLPAGPSISGRVELAPALKGKVPAGAVVFVFARAPDGPPMPLAAFRGDAAALPLEFTLDDSASMMGASLADHARVDLAARISLSGQPQAGSGDLEGSLSAVKVGSRGVRLVIDRVVP